MFDNHGYRWYTPLSEKFLEKSYLLPGQTLPQRVQIIRDTFAKYAGDTIADTFVEYLKKGWYSLSTPVWANYGTTRGLEISCFGSYIEDTMESILYTQAEMGMMSKIGGGTSAYFGDVRSRGTPITNNGQSSGAVHFMQLTDKLMEICSQGSTRRGSCAVYLPVDHTDIHEFLTIRSEGSPIQGLSFGVCIPDYWLKEMLAGDEAKQEVWAEIINTRIQTGYPYLFFTDNANSQAPQWYKDKGLKIHASQLCTEIFLHSSKDQSFVCCLSSMNILHFDEWKDTEAVHILAAFLDSVMSEFIRKAETIKFMERAVRFAEQQRAIGIGWLGWHSYLQSKMIPWESFEAKLENVKIAKTIQEQTDQASWKLSEEYGEPPLLIGYKRRFSTTQAVAPTKSSAFILGQVSEGVEPERANIYVKDLSGLKVTVKNKYLETLLADLGQNTDEVWDSINSKAGSVQHLDFLTEHQKDVFKTFAEISPKEIIIQAAQRQKYIDQGQSINLMIDPESDPADISDLYLFAWEQGLKSLYYQLGTNAAQKTSRNLMECKSCES